MLTKVHKYVDHPIQSRHKEKPKKCEYARQSTSPQIVTKLYTLFSMHGNNDIAR